MPEVVMLPQESTVSEKTDVTSHIKDLKEFMDIVDLMPDGFSDSGSSSCEEQTSPSHHRDTSPSEKRHHNAIFRKNGLFERHTPLKIYRSKKTKNNHHQPVRPKSSGTIKTEKHLNIHLKSECSQDENEEPKCKSSDKEKREQESKCEIGSGSSRDDDQGNNKHRGHHSHHVKKHHEPTSHHEKLQESDHSHDHISHGRHNHHGKHHHHSHGKLHHERHHGDKTENSGHVSAIFESVELTRFDPELFKPIMTGQSDSDVTVPIMTPPLNDIRNGLMRCGSAKSTYYARPMSLNFLLAGEKLVCNFDESVNCDKSMELVSYSDKDETAICFCSSSHMYDETFSGWEATPKTGRSKLSRRRKYGKPHSSDATSGRLPQTMGKDPVIFHHYKDYKKYMERYRFYHTVGNTGRPPSYSKYEKGVDTDPYLMKMKSNLSSAIGSPFYSFTNQLNEEKLGSASSGGSAPDRLRSDDESLEGSTMDAKPYSMRDRGKALNLAPVRECTVPNLRPSEKIDIIQLNQYLNLTTPPVPNNCLQFESHDHVEKRFAYRTGNPVDSNTMLATSGSRRGARTLRLGSAEFVKPGTPDSDVRWSCEKRGLQRSATIATSTVQGNLIVGSTISSPIPPATRAKSGGKVPPYVQFQRDNIHRPPSPPQHISGQRLKACDRVAELSGKERGKFSYTHAAGGEKSSPVIRTATAVDFKEAYIHHNRSQTITLDINHLGIRGQPFKRKEQVVLYKNRRAQVVRT